jgi:hypothetical protein
MSDESDDQTFDLEDRLIDFAVRIIRTAESLFDILRFCGSPLNGSAVRCSHPSVNLNSHSQLTRSRPQCNN